jgi:hypothetical protein
VNDLSPATQAVLDAAQRYEINPECYSRQIAAAALRAVADQVIPEVLLLGSDYQEIALQEARKAILAIADELEGQP